MAAVVIFMGGWMNAIANGDKIDNFGQGLGYFAAGAGKSAISYGISFGISGVGDILGHSAGSFGTELIRAGAHGALNGVANLAYGDSFWGGFATGAVSSLAGSGLQALGASSDLVLMGAGFAGAGMSYAMGGNVLSGFSQGFGIGQYNHVGEKIIGDDGKEYTLSFDDVEIWGKRRSLWSTIWNSNIVRQRVPDIVSLSVNFSLVGFAGFSYKLRIYI